MRSANVPRDLRWRADVCVVALFALIGTFGYSLRAVGWFADFPGGFSDPRFNSVILEHVFRWLTGREASLWSPKFFFPYSDVLAFSDNHFGTVLIYVLARLSGFSREIAFDLWFVVGAIANYFACIYASRKLGFDWLASGVAAFVFAFSLPVFMQEGHAQLGYRFAVPLAVLELIRFSQSRGLASLANLTSWVAIEFFCSIYLGVFLVMLLLALAMALTLTRVKLANVPISNERSHSSVASTLLAATLSLLLLLMLWKYHVVANEYGLVRSQDVVISMLPRIGSYFSAYRSGASAWIGLSFNGSAMGREEQMFFGLGVVALMAAGAIEWGRVRLLSMRGQQTASDNEFRFFFAVFGTALLLLIGVTLRVHNASFYTLIAELPGINAIRAVSRICLIMLMPVAVLAAMGTRAVAARIGTLPTLAATAILLSVEVFAYEPNRYSIADWRARDANITAQWLRQTTPPGAIVYVLAPNTESWYLAELDAMQLAQEQNIPTLNGYSGNAPPGYVLPTTCASAMQRVGTYYAHLPGDVVKAQLAQLDGHLLVLPAGACSDETLRRYERMKPFFGPLPEAVFPAISLAISGLRVAERDIVFRVDVQDHSNSYLPAMSLDRKPVSLSWRFVPGGANGLPVEWVARHPLESDIAPGSAEIEDLRAKVPSEPGRYVLEVSMVQDNVAWFHDRGMRVARAVSAIEVSQDGSIKLDPEAPADVDER